MNFWIVSLLFHIIFSVVFNQFYKLSVKSMKNSGALTLSLQFCAGIVSALFIPFFIDKVSMPTDPKVYFLILVSSVFYAIANRIATDARKELEVSVFTILNQLKVVVVTLAGFILFNEQFFINKLLGTLIIVFSNVMIFYEKGKFKFNKGLLLGLLSNIAYSAAMVSDISFSGKFNLGFYLTLTFVIPAIFILIFERINFHEIKTEFKNQNKKYFFTTAISWSIAAISILWTYQLKDASIVAPLAAIVVIANTIVGYIFLDEKDNLIKKIIAGILIVIAIFLINM